MIHALVSVRLREGREIPQGDEARKAATAALPGPGWQ